MKTVEFVLADTTYYLCLNGSALFSCYDHLGTDFIEKISGDTKDSFEATCWMLSTLAMQGEIVRRWEGQDKGPMLSSQKAAALLMPQDVVRARESILAAYDLAFQRETATDDEEIDLGLLELQKKTGKGRFFHRIFSGSRSFSG